MSLWAQHVATAVQTMLTAQAVFVCSTQSVINRSLLDRQDILKEIIIDAPKEGFPISSAMKGRVVALLPGAHLPSMHKPLEGARSGNMMHS